MRRLSGWYTFCMALHSRLGAGSPARHLDKSHLQLIFEHYKSPRGLELEITQHSVHRVKSPDDYIVSNLRRFTIEAVLFHKASRRPAEHSLWLRAVCFTEDGRPVTPCSRCTAGCESCMLTGETESVVHDGVATFRELKMGKLLLSARHGGQRFRIRIEPKDPELRTHYPELHVLSEPFRVVTKLPPPPPMVQHPSHAAQPAYAMLHQTGAAASAMPQQPGAIMHSPHAVLTDAGWVRPPAVGQVAQLGIGSFDEVA